MLEGTRFEFLGRKVEALKGIWPLMRCFLFWASLMVPPAIILWLSWVAILDPATASENSLPWGASHEPTDAWYYAGYALLACFAVAWVWLLLLIGYTIMTYFRIPYLPRPAAAPDVAIMEINAAGVPARRRICKHENMFQGDRVYHSPKGCAFMYSHKCQLLRVGVYANNLKPYILLHFLMVWYNTLGIAIIIYGFCDRRVRMRVPVTSSFALLGLVLTALQFYSAIIAGNKVFRMFLLDYALQSERNQGILIRFCLPGYVPQVFCWTPTSRYPIFASCGDDDDDEADRVPHPYDLGSVLKNLAELMGPIHLLPLFWLQTPIMKHGSTVGPKFFEYCRSKLQRLPQVPSETVVRRRQFTSSDLQTTLQATADARAVTER